MKQKLLTLFFALLAGLSAWAYDFEVDGMYYVHYGNGGNEVFLCNSGSYLSKPYVLESPCFTNSNSYSGDVIIPITVEYEGFEYDVVGVALGTFKDCDLTSITIPQKIKYLDYAFYGAKVDVVKYYGNIEEWCTIYRHDGLPPMTTQHFYFFDYATHTLIEQTDIVIPSTVTELSDDTFSGFAGINSITMESPTPPIIGSTPFKGIDITIIVPDGAKDAYQEAWGNSYNFKEYGSEEYKGVYFYDNEWRYQVNQDEKTVTIVRCPPSLEGDVTIPSTAHFDKIDKSYTVNSIGENVFENKTGITSIDFPNSITGIGDYAFRNCSGLTSLVITSNVMSIGSSAFYGCSRLTSVEIPSNVTSIGDYAFNGCTSIKNLTIEDGSETLSLGCNSTGRGLFYDCPLESVYLGRNISYNSDHQSGYTPFNKYSPFANKSGITELTISEQVTTIGYMAFYGCSGLTSIVIPNSVTEIGSYAFYDCSGLTSLTIGGNVSQIGESAFAKCGNSLSLRLEKSLNIEDIETALDLSVFEGCNIKSFSCDREVINSSDRPIFNSALTTVVFGENVTKIGDNMFKNCTGLTSLSIGENITTIGARAFEGCTGLTSLSIGENINSIGSRAFSGCTGLTFLSLGESITAIESYTFEGCTELTSLSLGGNINTIESHAFEGCTGLTSLTIGGNVSKIGEGAFDNCSIQELTFEEGESDLQLSSVSFNGNKIESATINRNISTGSFGNESPFRGSSTLKDISIGSNVTEIGSYLFYGCSSISEIDLKNVTMIHHHAFYESSIASLTIPSTTTYIGDGAFANCSNLISIRLEDSESWLNFGLYAQSCFSNCPIEKLYVGRSLSYSGIDSPFKENTQLNEVTFGNVISIIPDGLLYGCSSITSMTIPKNILGIEKNAFYGCTGINNIIIEDSENPLFIAFNNIDDILQGIWYDCPITQLYIGRNIYENINYDGWIDYEVYPMNIKTTLTDVDITIGNKVTVMPTYLLYGRAGQTEVSATIKAGSTINALFGCAENYTLSSFSIDGEKKEVIANNYTISNSAKDTKIVATFAKGANVYIIDPSSVYGYVHLYSVIGETAVIGISENTGYTLSDILVNGNSAEYTDNSDGTYMLSGLKDNDVISVSFVEISSTISVGEITNGTVSIISKYLDSAIIMATANEGYAIGKILVDGEDASAASYGNGVYSINNLKGFSVITVTFKSLMATSIDNISIVPIKEGTYNLQGQKLTVPQRGINIINGKKVIVR